MADHIISLRGVSRYFGPVAAVDDLTFDIARGEFFSLLGASGCGKTTLLRMLAGLQQPSAGEIFIDGVPMAGVPANLRPTNMVFQSYAIFPHLNVRENVGYGLRRLKLGKQETGLRIEQALALVKLEGFGERGANQLSGGQRQRVALARALVCRPKVLLLDEPLGALDKKLREEMQLELRQLQRSVGITFVFVTHDQEEALTLSDRIAVMARGKALQIDTATNLYEKPNCRDVAEFIGTMNFIPGRLKRVTKGVATVDAGPLGRLDVAAAGRMPPIGSPVTLAVRPEKIMLSHDKPMRGTNTIAGRLGAYSYFGDRSHYFIEVAGIDKPLAVVHQNSGLDPGRAPPASKIVWLTWPAKAGVLLTG